MNRSGAARRRPGSSISEASVMALNHLDVAGESTAFPSPVMAPEAAVSPCAASSRGQTIAFPAIVGLRRAHGLPSGAARAVEGRSRIGDFGWRHQQAASSRRAGRTRDPTSELRAAQPALRGEAVLGHDQDLGCESSRCECLGPGRLDVGQRMANCIVHGGQLQYLQRCTDTVGNVAQILEIARGQQDRVQARALGC